MARKKIIAGNWKMNMTPSEAVKLVETLKPLVVIELEVNWDKLTNLVDEKLNKNLTNGGTPEAKIGRAHV